MCLIAFHPCLIGRRYFLKRFRWIEAVESTLFHSWPMSDSDQVCSVRLFVSCVPIKGQFSARCLNCPHRLQIAFVVVKELSSMLLISNARLAIGFSHVVDVRPVDDSTVFDEVSVVLVDELGSALEADFPEAIAPPLSMKPSLGLWLRISVIEPYLADMAVMSLTH